MRRHFLERFGLVRFIVFVPQQHCGVFFIIISVLWKPSLEKWPPSVCHHPCLAFWACLNAACRKSFLNFKGLIIQAEGSPPGSTTATSFQKCFMCIGWTTTERAGKPSLIFNTNIVLIQTHGSWMNITNQFEPCLLLTLLMCDVFCRTGQVNIKVLVITFQNALQL